MNTTNTPSPAPPALSQEDRNWAMAAHLSALAALVVFFIGGVLGPLIVWLIKKDQSPFAAEAAKEALNFNITVGIGFLICTLLAFVFIGIPLMFVLGCAWLVLVILAGIRAGEGAQYRYPVNIRFIK